MHIRTPSKLEYIIPLIIFATLRVSGIPLVAQNHVLDPPSQNIIFRIFYVVLSMHSSLHNLTEGLVLHVTGRGRLWYTLLHTLTRSDATAIHPHHCPSLTWRVPCRVTYEGSRTYRGDCPHATIACRVPRARLWRLIGDQTAMYVYSLESVR